MSLDRAALVGLPYGAGTTEDGRVEIAYVAQVGLNDDGTFEYSLPTEGEVMFLARTGGRAPARVRLPWVSQDRAGIEIPIAEAPRGTTERRFALATDEFRGGLLAVIDVTESAVQPLVEVSVGTDGRFDGSCLEQGRDYLLMLRWKAAASGATKSTHGFITWDGREVIEESALLDADEFRRRASAPADGR